MSCGEAIDLNRSAPTTTTARLRAGFPLYEQFARAYQYCLEGAKMGRNLTTGTEEEIPRLKRRDV